MMKNFTLSNIWNYFYDRLSEKVEQRLLDNIYLHTKRSLSTLLLLNIIFFLFFLGKVPETSLYIWSLLTITLNISRIRDSFLYLGQDHSKDYISWHKKFTVKSLLTALLWGSISLLFLPYIDDQEIRNIIFLFVIGIGSGAMTSISPDFRTAAIYLFLLISPLFLYFVIQGGYTNYLLAFMLSAYYMLILNVCRSIGESLIATYKKEEEYEAIQKELYLKQSELNLLFRNTPVSILYIDNEYRVFDCNDTG